MKQFTTDEIRKLLRAIDKQLKTPFVITIIGGAAAALAYQAVDYTRDIDTKDSVAELKSAYEKAVEATGLDIPLSPAGVWDGPHNLEDRLQRVELKGLTMLTVMVPEMHDWVLMKIMRGYEHDQAMIQEVHEKQGLDAQILVKRFLNEMSHATGDRRKLELNFLTMLARVFGDEEAERVERQFSKKMKS